MISHLYADSLPAIYQAVYCMKKGVMVGKIKEADLDTLEALQLIGFQEQHWDNDYFLAAAERWGAKNVMKRVGVMPWHRRFCKVPINAIIEGRESKRYAPGVLHGSVNIYQRVILDEVEVLLSEKYHDQAHLIHPNCIIRFI